jgi:hypothetical protein
MPRSSFARARKFREPAAPVVFELSPEISTVMHRLIRLNPVQFGWTGNFKLGCVIVSGSKPKEQGGCVVLARFAKVPPLWHGLTGYDAIIRVEAWAWSRLGPAEQEALIAHELCHGSMSDKGMLRVEKHDLEEFGFVVRKYGAWQQSIALFDKQLAMFEPSFGTTATVEGDQIVVPFERPARRNGTAPAASPAEVLAKTPEQAAANVTAKRSRRQAAWAARELANGLANDDLFPGELHCEGSVHLPGCEHFDGPELGDA